MGRAYTFWCARCELELADGVDYTTCPRCGDPVTWAPLEPRALATPTLAEVTRATFGVLIGLLIVLAVADPHGFHYLRVVFVIMQLAAIPGALAAIVFVPAIRALLDERTRILHGLEHATIAVLAERGIEVSSGVTLAGNFELVLPSEYGATTGAIRDAVVEACRRVRMGEHALAYSDRCGTSYVVGWLVVAVAVATAGALALVHDMPYGYNFAATAAALAGARLASRRLGLLAQRLLTVSTRLGSARTGKIARELVPGGAYVRFAVCVTVEPRSSSSVIGEPV